MSVSLQDRRRAGNQELTENFGGVTREDRRTSEKVSTYHSHITLQPKTGCPLKLSRFEPGQYLDGRPPGKTRLLLEEVLVRPAGGAHPVVCVGPN